jgi:simple sugar transport system permease protein
MKQFIFDSKLVNSILPVLLAFVLGAVIIFIIGENPFLAFRTLLGRTLFTSKGFANTLHYASPLLIAGLAIAITFKANIFNMGVEGQLIFGGFFAGLVGAYVQGMNPALHKLLAFATGAFCGMSFALIPALLRAFFRVDEMVVTLTLNYAMEKILEFLSAGPFRESGSGYVSTPIVQESAMFIRIGNSRLTLFSVLAFVFFLIMAFIMNKTRLGYEIEAIGKNPLFAEATGIRGRRKIIVLMLLSGALSGIAGTGHMLSEQFKYTLNFSGIPGLGWDGMLIALLGRHSPFGILAASVFYSALKSGSDNINMYTNIPKEIVAIIQSLIIMFLAIRFFNERYSLLSNIRMSRLGRQLKKEAAKNHD